MDAVTVLASFTLIYRSLDPVEEDKRILAEYVKTTFKSDVFMIPSGFSVLQNVSYVGVVSDCITLVYGTKIIENDQILNNYNNSLTNIAKSNFIPPILILILIIINCFKDLIRIL